MNNIILIFIIMIIVVLTFLEIFVMTDTKHFWLGAIIPTLFTIGTIFLMISNKSYAPGDWFHVILIILYSYLIMWNYGYKRHIKRTKKHQR